MQRRTATIAKVIRLVIDVVVHFIRLFFSRTHWDAIKWSINHKEGE